MNKENSGSFKVITREDLHKEAEDSLKITKNSVASQLYFKLLSSGKSMGVVNDLSKDLERAFNKIHIHKHELKNGNEQETRTRCINEIFRTLEQHATKICGEEEGVEHSGSKNDYVIERVNNGLHTKILIEAKRWHSQIITNKGNIIFNTLKRFCKSTFISPKSVHLKESANTIFSKLNIIKKANTVIFIKLFILIFILNPQIHKNPT